MPYVTIADSDIAINRSLYPEILKRIRDNPGIQASHSDPAAPRTILDQVTLAGDGPALCWPDGAGSVIMRAMHSGIPYDFFTSNPAWAIPIDAHQLLVECWGGGSWSVNGGTCGGYCIGLFDITAATAAIVVGLGNPYGQDNGQNSSFTLGAQSMFARGGVKYNTFTPTGPVGPGTGGFLNIGGGMVQAARGGGAYGPSPVGSYQYRGTFPGGRGNNKLSSDDRGANGLVRVRVIG